jgi:formate dehydrogenase subunit beta
MHATGSSRMLAPVVVEDGVVNAEVIPNGGRMTRVNPLLPLMHADVVAALRSSREGAPAEAMLAVLRPCEVRAAVELAKQGKLDLSNAVLVGTDCMSTYELAYWERGEELHRGSPDWLVDEALQLAQAGQIRVEGIRLSCRLCDRPAADYRAADLLIGLVGVQNQERLLVLADEAKDARWDLQGLTDRPATERETADREVALWRLADRRKEASAACLHTLGLAGSHPAAIMRHMSKCTLCGDCIDVCPRWSEELRAALTRGREAFLQALLDAARRLAGCAECGMCQVECSEGIPLSAIQRAFGLQVQNRMHSAASRDSRDPLPWTT